MVPHFNFEEYNRLIENDTNGRGAEYTLEDGTLVTMIDGENPIIYEYAPSPSFLKTEKTFYPDGSLQSQGDYLGEYVPVGEWKYYNEKGQLTETVDENQKFQKMKPENVLDFLDKRGYIDLATGKGRFTETGNPAFLLQFMPATEDSGDSQWTIYIPEGKKLTAEEFEQAVQNSLGEPSHYKPLRFTMNGQTGVVNKLP